METNDAKDNYPMNSYHWFSGSLNVAQAAWCLHATGRRQGPARGSHGSHGSYSQGGSYSSNSRAPGYGATSGSYGGSRSSGPIKRPAVIGATDSMLGQGGQGTQGIPAARSYGTKGGDRNGYGTHRSHESHPYAQETRSTTSVGGGSWVKLCFQIQMITSSTAQGGGGSFKNRKPIGEIGCCESGMAERIH